jgi:hypothetical protein
MRVITNSPIVTESTSERIGSSNFEGFSNADDSRKRLFGKKSTSSDSTSENKEKFGTKVKDFFSESARSERQSSRAERKTKRQTKRLKRREDRKPKRNARKLVVLDAGGNEMTFYPLSPLVFKNGKWYKRKLVTGTDGKPTYEWKVVESKNILRRKNKRGQTVAIDKTEVEKASGTTLTNEEAVKKVGDLPPPTNTENQQAITEAGNASQGAFVPTDNTVVAGDNNVFLEEDTQPLTEPTKEATETPQMSRTQKIVLWSVGIVALGVIGYAVYRSMNKAK